MPLKRNGLRAEPELGRRPQSQDQAVAPKIIIFRAREIDRELILAEDVGSNPIGASNKLSMASWCSGSTSALRNKWLT